MKPQITKAGFRLGTNEDLKNFVAACHEKEIKVIFDGVFNHTGRDFFAFKDIQQNREHSRYLNWYCNVNFGGIRNTMTASPTKTGVDTTFW